MKGAVLSCQFRDAAVWIVAVAEHERRCGTALHAGRRNVAVPYRPSFLLRLLFPFADALHAERAFFHDAVLPDRDVGIQLFRQRLVPVRVEPIELPGGIGAIVPTVTDSDAAVVDLRVEPFGRMIRRVHRTDRLAGRIVAMLAEHGHESRPDIRILPFPITFDSDPIDRPPLCRFVFPGNADVIFRMAGHDAGLAAGTAIEIDHHFPFMRFAG